MVLELKKPEPKPKPKPEPEQPDVVLIISIIGIIIFGLVMLFVGGIFIVGLLSQSKSQSPSDYVRLQDMTAHHGPTGTEAKQIVYEANI